MSAIKEGVIMRLQLSRCFIDHLSKVNLMAMESVGQVMWGNNSMAPQELGNKGLITKIIKNI